MRISYAIGKGTAEEEGAGGKDSVKLICTYIVLFSTSLSQRPTVPMPFRKMISTS